MTGTAIRFHACVSTSFRLIQGYPAYSQPKIPSLDSGLLGIATLTVHLSLVQTSAAWLEHVTDCHHRAWPLNDTVRVLSNAIDACCRCWLHKQQGSPIPEQAGPICSCMLDILPAPQSVLLAHASFFASVGQEDQPDIRGIVRS